jgi:hypothetical protein
MSSAAKNALPITLHADQNPALWFGSITKCAGECSDVSFRPLLNRTIGILAIGIVMNDGYCDPLAVSCRQIRQHLPVANAGAKCRVAPPVDVYLLSYPHCR